MKSKITQTFCSLILMLALMMGIIVNSRHRFVPNSIKPTEAQQIVEAGHFGRAIRMWVAYLKTVDWSKGGYHPKDPKKGG